MQEERKHISSEKDRKDMAEGLGETAKAFSGKTILITGGRGFLGRYFTDVFSYLNDHILDKKCKLIVVDNMITAGALGESAALSDDFKFLKHDFINPLKIDEPIHYVLHAAGIASPHYYRKYPLETLDVAIKGTRNALELAKDHNAKIAFFSSSEIYGDPDPKFIPTTEEYRGNVCCLGPRACYDESKRVGETLCRIYHQKYGVQTRMIRPFNVYGPGMQENDYRVLPNFASRIVANKPLKIYGTGNQTRTFCYISDAIVGFLKVLEHGKDGEPYNIGNPTPEVSMIELAKAIGESLGKKIDIERVDYPETYPADEPNRRCPNIGKAQSDIGYGPKVNLHEGLKRFFNWAEAVYVGDR